MDIDLYTYEATLLRVVDADTVDLLIDLGCSVTIKERCRLYGINAPEMRTPEGKAAKQYVDDLIGPRIVTGRKLTIRTYKDKRGKYGRYLVTIFFGASTVNTMLVESGHAVEYYP